MTLKEVKIGQSCVVEKISGEGSIRRRLIDMGITPGIEILLLKSAPLGDPIEIAIRGYKLSLRKREAETIEVKIK